MGKDQVVRQKHLDRFEKALQKDMADKTAKAMRRFGEKYMKPTRRKAESALDRADELREDLDSLEQRYGELEQRRLLQEHKIRMLQRPWYRKLWSWFEGLFRWD